MPDGRVVTAKLPDDLVSRVDEVADRIDRSKSWIVRQSVTEWLAGEERRCQLTLEALQDVDEGRTIPREAALAMVEQRKRETRKKQPRGLGLSVKSPSHPRNAEAGGQRAARSVKALQARSSLLSDFDRTSGCTEMHPLHGRFDS
jgi:predicted transcriptional regulator